MKKLYVTLLLSFLALPVFAQETDQPHILGLGVQRDAAYLGAAKHHWIALPLINWQTGKFFVRSGKGLEEAGVHWQLDQGISMGAQLALELGRDPEDAELLQHLHLQKIDYGVSLGAHIEHETHIGPAPLATLLRLRQRSGAERGALADMRMELGVFGNQTFGLQTYIQATWADGEAMASDFGIPAENAAYLQIAPYAPAGGLRDSLIGLAGKIDLNRKWMVVASLERRSLRRDAAHSPIAEQKNTNTFTIGALRRF
ncbi:MAG TPA: MipA/OmpV family protein [Cellvibrio sp.]|nr:MipA/OmpV family protein [Cellvibrio sp.]